MLRNPKGRATRPSELTGISYTNGGTNLGNLTYSYDLAGRRTNLGGSYAQTGLPQAVSTTVYNANNQLTQWGTATPTYDYNGNMLSDGTNSLVWNARNLLSSMNSGLVSFQYDPYGRRSGKTVAGITTSYVYDGANIAQEISGGSPIANLLSGGVDEVFTRTDSSGTANFLTDALGSTLALTNSSGSALAQYAYEPFGNTTVTSGSSTNPYQYTGRENDGTGLYFNRGRYYNPTLQRFVSEDPIGLAGGNNLYAYVGNDPADFVDRLGLDKQDPLQRNSANPPYPAPNGPGGKPAPPPIDPPTGKDGKPIDWIAVPGSGPWGGVRWVPDAPVPSPDGRGGQPNVVWDPYDAWWTHNDGGGGKQHVDPQGNPISSVPLPSADSLQTATKVGVIGTIIYIGVRILIVAAAF